MTRKFLFCFPLRTGNIVLGYIIVTIAIMVFGYHLYELGLTMVSKDYEHEKFRNFQNLENIFGKSNTSLVACITMSYYTTYCAIAFLLFLFGIMLVCGAYQANYCLVTTFFVYSFFHMFFTVILIVWEAVSKGWIQMGLVVLSDGWFHSYPGHPYGLAIRVPGAGAYIKTLEHRFTASGLVRTGPAPVLLIICLFSVKYLMEAIRTGNIYSRPTEVLCSDKYNTLTNRSMRDREPKYYYKDFDR